MITDIHSHHLGSNPEGQIISLCMKDHGSYLFCKAVNISVGIHPWYLSEDSLMQQIEWVNHVARNDKRTVAIGECGTDKVCDTSSDLQIAAFTSMIKISEELRLPLIIHSVKTTDKIIYLKKQTNPKQSWIIHGFRGKKEAALQLINHNIYISIGERFNCETIKIIPSHMLVAETDESNKSISQISGAIAKARNMSNVELTRILTENTNKLFFNR